jgi:hypothetical protein
MKLTEGQIVGVSGSPQTVWIQVWPARALEIPVRDAREFAGRIGASVTVEIEDDPRKDDLDMPKELDFHVKHNDEGFFVATCSQYPNVQGVSTGLLGAIDSLLVKIAESVG